MTIQTTRSDDALTVHLTGELDHHSAAGWRSAIDREAICCRPKRLVLDFSEVTFMDSSGIGLVMGRYKLMRSWGGDLRLCGLSPRLRQMMSLAGIDRLPVWEEGENHETH